MTRRQLIAISFGCMSTALVLCGCAGKASPPPRPVATLINPANATIETIDISPNRCLAAEVLVLRPSTSTDRDAFERLVRVVEARVTALDPSDTCTSDVVSTTDRIEVHLARASRNGVPLEVVRSALLRHGNVEFRPVVGSTGGSYDVANSETLSDNDGRTFVVGPSALGVGAIRAATVEQDASGVPAIHPVLTDVANAEFNAVAKANVGKQVAIVVDGSVFSAPVIQAPAVFKGSVQITGIFSTNEARSVAAAIGGGELPVPLEVVEVRPK